MLSSRRRSEGVAGSNCWPLTLFLLALGGPAPVAQLLLVLLLLPLSAIDSFTVRRLFFLLWLRTACRVLLTKLDVKHYQVKFHRVGDGIFGSGKVDKNRDQHLSTTMGLNLEWNLSDTIWSVFWGVVYHKQIHICSLCHLKYVFLSISVNPVTKSDFILGLR